MRRLWWQYKFATTVFLIALAVLVSGFLILFQNADDLSDLLRDYVFFDGES